MSSLRHRLTQPFLLENTSHRELRILRQLRAATEAAVAGASEVLQEEDAEELNEGAILYLPHNREGSRPAT